MSSYLELLYGFQQSELRDMLEKMVELLAEWTSKFGLGIANGGSCD